MSGDAKAKKARWTPHGRLRERERLVRARDDISSGAVCFFAVVAQGIKLKTGFFEAIDEEMEVRTGGVSRSTLSRHRRELHDAGELNFEPGHPGVPTRYWLPERTDDEIQRQLNELNRRVAAAYRKAADDAPQRKSRVSNLRREKAIEVGLGDAHLEPAASRNCDTVASQNCDTYLPQENSLIPFLEREESYDLQAEFLFEEEKEEEHCNGVEPLRSDVEDGISRGSELKETREDSGEPGGALEPRLGCKSEAEAQAMLDREVAELTQDRDFRMIVGEGSEEVWARRVAVLNRYYLSGIADFVQRYPDDRISFIEGARDVAIEEEAKAVYVARRKAGGGGDD